MDLSVAREHYIQWLVATRDPSPHTARAYDGDLAAFELHVGRGYCVSDIGPDQLTAFVDAQRKAGLSARSIRRRASALRGFFRWLTAADLLAGDPWTGIELASRRARQLPRVVPQHELDRLIGHLRATCGLQGDVDFHAVTREPHAVTTLLAVTLMLATGVRVQEVVGIHCADVDPPSRSIRLLGKGRREREVYLTNDWVTDLASAYLAARERLVRGHTHLLFNRRLDPLTPPAMRARLARAAADAGVTIHITPHMLRHSAATQLIEAGVDIRYIQRLLGHASLTTTEIYTHVSNQALRRVVTEADVLGRLSAADN